MKLYRDLAGLYDLLERGRRDIARDVAFLASVFDGERTLLDLGCGTGEHLVYMADRFRVVGVDLHPEMLRVLREKLPGAEAVAGDLRALPLGGKFDGAFSMYGVLNYLPDDGAVRESLRQVRGRIRDGGTLVLEVWHARPLVALGSQPHGEVFRMGNLVRERGFDTLDAEAGSFRVRYRYELEGKEVRDEHSVIAFRKEQLTGLLDETGFRTEGIYGNTACDPLEDGSDRIITVSRVRH